MAARKRKEALGRGLDSLFSSGGSASGPENSPTANASVAPAGMAAFILMAFFLGGSVGFFLSKTFDHVSPGPPSARADAVPPVPVDPPFKRSGDQKTIPSTNPAKSLDLPQEGSSGPGFTPPPQPDAFHDPVLRGTLHKTFPLTPEDIDLLRKTVKETQKAVHGPVPEGRAVSVRVSLDPGARFPEIHLVPGIATTISVVDATGAPWPIEDMVVGNSKSFPVRRLMTSNGVVVEPKNNVGWTSLSLILSGRGTPAVLKLIDSDHLSDTRVTARIEARGPNAAAPIFREAKPVVSNRVLAYLDGIPPPSARAVPVRGTKDMEVWQEGSRLFVRTHLDVLAPAWLETVSGPNGMKLYVFSPVSVITAAGEDGEMLTVELGEGETDAGKQ